MAIVGWIAAYTISLLMARVVSVAYIDGSFEAMLATFVVLATGLNLMVRSNCDGPRKLWYIVCVFAMVFVGLYLSGEAHRVQQLREHAIEMDGRVSDMVSNCPGAVFATTQDGTIRAVNRGASQLTGYSQGELVGATLTAIMEDSEAADRILWRRQSTANMHTKDSPGWVMSAAKTKIKRRDGSMFDAKIYAFGLRHSVFGGFPDDVQFVSILVEDEPPKTE